MTQEQSWQVRRAKATDVSSISELAKKSNEFLMPYVLNPWILEKYVDQFYVAERLERDERNTYNVVGGAVHVIEHSLYYSSQHSDKVDCFLHYVKQVPDDVIIDFTKEWAAGKKIAIIGQIVCPGKGSFYTILEGMKKKYNELWCWMSVVGPSYKSYQRYGFTFDGEEREFWNVYKCDYSKFKLGKWRREDA